MSSEKSVQQDKVGYSNVLVIAMTDECRIGLEAPKEFALSQCKQTANLHQSSVFF